MPLKVAITAQDARTTTGDQSFTDSNAGFDSDLKLAIFSGSTATAWDTATSISRFSMGWMCTGPDHFGIGVHQDGSSVRNSNAQTASAYSAPNSSTGSDCEFAGHSTTPFLSNGVQVTYSDAASEAHKINALLMGGDIEANIIVVDLNSVSSVTGVSHGLSGAPEVIIAASIFDPSGLTNQTDVYHSVGFWDGTNYVSSCFLPASHVAVAGRISTSALLGVSDSSGNIGSNTITLANVGASTLDVVAGTTVDFAVALLCLRGTSSPLEAKCGVYTTPTSTGDSAMGLSLGAAPQVLMMMPSRHTAIDTGATDASAGVVGLFCAANNAGAGTQYGGIAYSSDDSSAVYSRAGASNALVVPASDGSADVEATVKASTGWGSDDITLNFSNVAASALKIPYLAFGIQSATKKLKLLAAASAQSATGVSGVVFDGTGYTTSDYLGAFSGKSFEASLESGSAVLKVPVADFGGSALTTSSTPSAFIWNSSDAGIGPADCTVIEE